MLNTDKKLYYSIGEIAKMFDVKTSLIRFWEKEFDVLKPKRNRKGNRFFRPEDIDNLKLIYFYTKERGMTLNGVKKRLKENKTKMINNFDIIKKLQSIQNQLIEIKDSMV